MSDHRSPREDVTSSGARKTRARARMPFPAGLITAAVVATTAISACSVTDSGAVHESASRGTTPVTTGGVAPTGTASIGTASSADGRASACRAAQLAGKVTATSSIASQPFVIIALTDTSDSNCSIDGYPGIAVVGHPDWYTAPPGPLRIKITYGPGYSRPDPGPSRLTLVPRGSASFALSTSTAIGGGGHTYSIVQVLVTPPGDTASVVVAAPIVAAGLVDQPIPITVTAFVIGPLGPSS